MDAGRASTSALEVLSSPLPKGLTRLAWAPLWREQQSIGVLIADELPEDELKTFVTIANQLSLQLSRIALYQQVESLAVTDSLTGLNVRRHFLERAQDELVRAGRHGRACTLLMVDLDHFKQINDSHGHLVGDAVLKDVAQLLQRNLREIDLIARYGGEEFILLLTETPAEHAMPIAQRLRQLVEVHPIRAYDELVAQTISIGMASFPQRFG
jgi:diguanylate cyclase (GGDEF)-like protein